MDPWQQAVKPLPLPCSHVLVQVKSELAAIQKTVKQQMQSGGGSLREVFADPAARRAAKICMFVGGSFAALGITTVMAFTQLVRT